MRNIWSESQTLAELATSGLPNWVYLVVYGFFFVVGVVVGAWLF
jgi:hypothetical protein